MLALGSQTLRRSAWTHHSSSPSTKLTDFPTCSHLPCIRTKARRKTPYSITAKSRMEIWGPKSGNFLILLCFTLLFVLRIYLPINITWRCS